MSVFDLEACFGRAERRFGRKERDPPARIRSDRGVSRLDPQVVELVQRLAGGQERPRITELLAEVRRLSRERGLRAPSRAALYRLLDSMAGHQYQISALPHDVRVTLHNVEPNALVPGASSPSIASTTAMAAL